MTTVRWDELSKSEQAILANLQEEVEGYTAAFDDLIEAGLIDWEDGLTTTLAGQEVLDDAERRGLIRMDDMGYTRIRQTEAA